MFCPSCKVEYLEGYTVCANCGVELRGDRPPLESPPPTVAETAEPPRLDRYAPLGGLAKWLVAVLIAAAVLGAFMAAAEVAILFALPEFLDPTAEIEDSASLVLAIVLTLAGFAGMVALVACVVLFCVWAHRANRNARALGAEGMEFTPGWTVGWFFVPIANLFKPYQAIREVFQASEPAANGYEWAGATVPGFLKAWWGLWILANVIGNLQFRFIFSEDPAMLAVSAWIGAVAAAVDVIATVLVIKVIRAIGERQEDRYRRFAGTGSAGEPAPETARALEP